MMATMEREIMDGYRPGVLVVLAVLVCGLIAGCVAGLILGYFVVPTRMAPIAQRERCAERLRRSDSSVFLHRRFRRTWMPFAAGRWMLRLI